jgi:arabinan endo-1,5-alpha-L-arabinosidase
MRNVWLRAEGLRSAVVMAAVLSLAATAAVSARAQAPETTSASTSLKHRYSFSADARDSVGDAAGKLQGAAVVKDGKLVLDGSAGAYVDLPGGLLSDYKAATIEFWISTGQNGNYARVFDAGEISGRSGVQSIYFCVDHTATGDWRLKISVPDGKDQVVAIKGNLSGRKDLHVVNVLDPATGFMGIYVNGELVGSRTDLISLAAVSPHYFFIGRSLYAADAYLNASIDEFRIYDSALSAEQVKKDYSGGPDRMP